MNNFFNDFPLSSKVWAYVANRKLTDNEYIKAKEFLHTFTQNWLSHRQPVRGSFVWIDQQILILVADESEVSIGGCSMDSMNRTIKELGVQLNIDFFDRMNVAVVENMLVTLLPYSAIDEAILSGRLSADTYIFNTSVFTLHELYEKGKIKAGESWLKRHF